MKKGSCSKHFPKEFNDETTIDENGFAIYRCRDDGHYVVKNGIRLDNRWVVPYNMYFLKKFQSHINVEWCNKSKVIKYLFKYVTKGLDFANVGFKRKRGLINISETVNNEEIDEIEEYLECRYLCDKEALWRLYSFGIHSKTPSVERLAVHLPNMNCVLFKKQANLSDVVANEFLQRTTLTEWCKTNQKYPEAQNLTYCEFPNEWRWEKDHRIWIHRTRQKNW
jgi:hypothetical protein